MSNQIIVPPYQTELLYDKDFFQDYGIFVKPIIYPMSTKKIESLIEIAKMQKFLQCNPVYAIDLFFNIELLDMQSLAVERTWICPNSLLVCTRGWGKSTTIDLELMAKGMLFTNYWSYIASGLRSCRGRQNQSGWSRYPP